MLSIGVFHSRGEEVQPIRLVVVEHLSQFSFFARRTIRELLHFASRTIVQHTALGTRESVVVPDTMYVCHAIVRLDGLAVAVVVEKDYSSRVAVNTMSRVMQLVEQTAVDWRQVERDSTDSPSPQLVQLLQDCQDPLQVDPLLRVQHNLDDVKDIVTKNLEQLLKRESDLTVLMQKSNDLSVASLHFLQQAKKTNRCCKAW
jgi:synaptobrevin family protein YKT6